jgi:hypothetical protein
VAFAQKHDPADPELCPKSMTRHQNIRDQANQANEHAIQGGIDGGIRWFLAGVIVFGTAQLVWPPYRKLTPQFKVPPPPTLPPGETLWDGC